MNGFQLVGSKAALHDVQNLKQNMQYFKKIMFEKSLLFKAKLNSRFK
jgi:hypothetical protein